MKIHILIFSWLLAQSLKIWFSKSQFYEIHTELFLNISNLSELRKYFLRKLHLHKRKSNTCLVRKIYKFETEVRASQFSSMNYPGDQRKLNLKFELFMKLRGKYSRYTPQVLNVYQLSKTKLELSNVEIFRASKALNLN